MRAFSPSSTPASFISTDSSTLLLVEGVSTNGLRMEGGTLMPEPPISVAKPSSNGKVSSISKLPPKLLSNKSPTPSMHVPIVAASLAAWQEAMCCSWSESESHMWIGKVH
jgi:hypothetical protein